MRLFLFSAVLSCLLVCPAFAAGPFGCGRGVFGLGYLPCQPVFSVCGSSGSDCSIQTAPTASRVVHSSPAPVPAPVQYQQPVVSYRSEPVQFSQFNQQFISQPAPTFTFSAACPNGQCPRR